MRRGFQYQPVRRNVVSHMRVFLCRSWWLLLLCLPAITNLSAASSSKANALWREGVRLYEKGRFAEAAACFTDALEQNPQNPKIYYNRAVANEMVDRQQALRDWRRFLELAVTDPKWKSEVTRIQERLQTLEEMPALPATLQPAAYAAKAGDYYEQIAEESLGLRWTGFPVRVFVGSPPKDWQPATQEALDDWTRVFPLRLVNAKEDADIVLSWVSLPKNSGGSQPSGSEQDWIHSEKERGRLIERQKTSLITLDISRHWSEDEMCATVLHELGHALGIKGHSDSFKDVMFPEEQEVLTESKGGQDLRHFSRSGPSGVISTRGVTKKLTPRDINTLIRLYNCAGPLELLQ